MSYNAPGGSLWHAIDGKVIYDHIPANRWSNFDSKNEVDWYSIDFGPGRFKMISEVKLYVYSDVVTGEGRVGKNKLLKSHTCYVVFHRNVHV